MGFSLKVAPGVRVRASSRGVRTSLGPRVARVHVGAGRTGVSTGVGPVGYYTSVGSPQRRTNGTNSVNRQVAAAARQQALADKAAEAHRLHQVFEALLAVHRQEFQPARRAEALSPPEPPMKQFRARHRSEARKGTSVFDWSARRRALQEADRRANIDATSARAELARQFAEHQAQLEADWAALLDCDPDTVLHALGEAFEDNEAAAAAVGVDGSEVSLLVVVPPMSDLPERKPGITQAGNLSLKKLTKSEAAELYKQLVCGHLLVTLREAFAVAPAIRSARIVALRATSDAYGNMAPEVLAAVHCSRSALSGVRWDIVDAVQVVNDCSEERLLIQKGATRALQPVPLHDEPELRELLDAVDMSELLGQS